MNWIVTPLGQEYHLTGPAAMTDEHRPVDVQAVAHQLALINRWHGATRRPFSVAEHSLLCSLIAQRMRLPVSVQLATLWHDAHECVTQDVASPVKRAVNFLSTQAGGTKAWTYFEDQQAKRFRRALDLQTTFTAHRAMIHQIDLVALATERRDLTAYDPARHLGWDVLHDDDAEHRIEPLGWLTLNTAEREAMTWQDWRQAFIDRHEELVAQRSAYLGRSAAA